MKNQDVVEGNGNHVDETKEVYGLPPVLSVAQAAGFLGVNVKTLYAAINAGEVPGRKIGRRVVVLRDSLLEWLRSKTRVSSRKRRAR